jgi:hypothetical protein
MKFCMTGQEKLLLDHSNQTHDGPYLRRVR